MFWIPEGFFSLFCVLLCTIVCLQNQKQVQANWTLVFGFRFFRDSLLCFVFLFVSCIAKPTNHPIAPCVLCTVVCLQNQKQIQGFFRDSCLFCVLQNPTDHHPIARTPCVLCTMVCLKNPKTDSSKLDSCFWFWKCRLFKCWKGREKKSNPHSIGWQFLL